MARLEVMKRREKKERNRLAAAEDFGADEEVILLLPGECGRFVVVMRKTLFGD